MRGTQLIMNDTLQIDEEDADLERAILLSLQAGNNDDEETEQHAPAAASETTCPICLSAINSSQPARALQCGHAYHRDCIATWMHISASCPVCRHTA